MFGVSCAPELFQKTMETITAGLDGVIVYLDDAIVFGSNKTEHDRRLAALLKRFSEYDILLNEKKCIYGVESLEFLGHQLSSAGVRPTESRLSVIQKFREPQNVSELRSFLGLICYVGKFIPNLASKTEPLRHLLRSGVQFRWTTTESSVFQSIKSDIFKIHHLGFFNPKDRTKLMTDASPTGLGAVLLQEDSQGRSRVIAYASKALTDLEKKYFQTEREALSLVWGVEKFRLYLLGIKFTLLTDCKALKFLFNPKSRPCARIERWVLKLQNYTYDVEYIPGSANLADVFSRLCELPPEPFDEKGEKCIQSIVAQSIPKAITLQEIKEETTKDEELTQIMECLRSGIMDCMFKEYKPYVDELCSAEGVLLRGNRLVVPTKLRERVLAVAHEAHPGMAAMKRRLRTKVWWPAMDKQVEMNVKKCKDCILVSSLGPPEPVRSTTMPDKPWTDIAVDFMGPLPTGHTLFVMVDYFSRFTEAIVMKQITARRTVQALHETFSRFGIPESIRSDNGPQFVSEEMRAYCDEYGIILRKTTPYWPQANGEVERANKTILKHLKISQQSSSADWMWDLRSFLLMYNSTPHATTGVAPSILMFKRLLRDKLPCFGEQASSKEEEEVMDRDRARKDKYADYANCRRHAKVTEIREGDTVVVKRTVKDNKLSTTFAPEEYTVIKLVGSDATVQSNSSGRVLNRNVAHLKILPASMSTTENPPFKDQSAMLPLRDMDITNESEEAGPQETQADQSTSRSMRMSRKPAYLKDYHTDAVFDV